MATASGVRADLARQADQGNVITLIHQLTPEIEKALPSHIKPERIARIATTAVRLNPKLATCTPTSFMGALLTAAQLGLEPNTPTGEAYLVPFGRDVTLIVGYRGMIKLALQSGMVKNVSTGVVRERDMFDFRMGTDPYLHHVPVLDGQSPGPVRCYYAAATLTNGGNAFIVLDRVGIDRYRSRSRSSDSGPWATDYDAMAMKTCARRLMPFLPMSVEVTNLLAADGAVREVRPGDDLSVLDALPAEETTAPAEEPEQAFPEPDKPPTKPADGQEPAGW